MVAMKTFDKSSKTAPAPQKPRHRFGSDLCR